MGVSCCGGNIVSVGYGFCAAESAGKSVGGFHVALEAAQRFSKRENSLSCKQDHPADWKTILNSYGPQAPLGPSPTAEATAINIGWEVIVPMVAVIW